MADDGSTPGWFLAALEAPYASHTLEVEGCPLHYLAWGDPARPPLVLVHGGLAHARWWTAIAPQLARHYYVLAPDLAGHGDSGRRAIYTLETWAGDVMAVCHAAAGRRAPVIVGHSLGGQIAITAAAVYGAQLAGVVVVDAPVTRPAPENGALTPRARPLTVYPGLAGAMARFRLLPAQPCENGWLFRYIARHSLREVEGGWSWKFDPAVLSRPLPMSLADYLARAACPLAMVRGEYSAVVPPETAELMYELCGRSAPLIDIPCSWHHLLIDQPLAFLAALRALLAAWDHASVPVRRAQAAP
jgi:pimeloyl-ACP methyl ester carboxylesterase